MPLNIYTWLTWLVAILAALSMITNPLYLVVLWLETMILHFAIRPKNNTEGLSLPMVRMSFGMVLVAGLFNLMTSHVGGTVLWKIPGAIPLVSGRYTLEAFSYGCINGLVLANIVACFAIFNRVLEVRHLVGLIPRAFYPLAVVVSIALTFIPSSRQQIEEIHEAQLLRGHRIKGLGGWLPLLMPLIISSLEHSMQLAEAMTARGFSDQSQGDTTDYNKLGIVASLLLLLAGWLMRIWPEHRTTGTWLSFLACAAILILLWRASRRAKVFRLTGVVWKMADVFIICLSSGMTAGLSLFSGDALVYSPYPLLDIPSFDLRVGLILIIAAVPVFFTWSYD